MRSVKSREMNYRAITSPIFMAFALISLAACQTIKTPDPTSAKFDKSKIVLGNGDDNAIEMDGVERVGPTFIIPSVTAATDSFLVLHPFKDGKPVRVDYVAAMPVKAGETKDVHITAENAPETGEPYILMLHRDVNKDGVFDFGDGVTVSDAPIFEGYTMIAAKISAPEPSGVTPDIIRASAAQNAQLAANYNERADYRENATANRVKAIAHQWMASAEDAGAYGASARDLFAPEFQINFPSGPITTAQGLTDWLRGPAAQFAATRHVLSSMTIAKVADQRYRLDMDVSWDGLTSEDKRMSAKTRHIWYLIDNEDRAETLIETIDVVIEEPFAPAEWPSAEMMP